MERDTQIRAPTPEDVEIHKTGQRYLVLRYIVVFLGSIGIVLSAWVPLQGMVEITEALAGRNTRVSVALTVAISVGVVLGGTALLFFLRHRGLRAEVARLRARLDSLEREILKTGDRK